VRKGNAFHRVDAALAAYDGAIIQMRSEFDLNPRDPDDRLWVERKLAHMAKIDQFTRSQADVPFTRRYSTEETDYYWNNFRPRFHSIDQSNTLDLKRLLGRYGWFTISKWGEECDKAAWLIAQHADDDLAFQKEVLARLEPLHAIHETNPSNYAYLFDRIAVHEGRLQLYGTQGRCVGPGKWEPDPIENAELVDERRKAVGLGTMIENKRRLRDSCR
jgi:hypothetical protein